MGCLSRSVAAVVCVAAMAACAKPVDAPKPLATMRLRAVLPEGGAAPLNAWIVVETRRSTDGVWTYVDRLGGKANGPGPFFQATEWADTLKFTPADECRALVCADGYATAIRPFRAAIGETVDLGDITLDPGVELLGRVESTSGEPVSGAYVRGGMPLNGFGCPGSKFAISASDGSFRLAHLASGEQTILVQAKGLAPTAVHIDVVGAPLIVRVGTGEIVRATVVDLAGMPSAGVAIDFWPADAADSGVRFSRGRTDASGSCDLRVAEGRWRFVVEDAQAVVDVDAGGTSQVRLVLK